nr:MAG TPA: hypothetical protein [Caudoviricetes sp.]
MFSLTIKRLGFGLHFFVLAAIGAKQGNVRLLKM